MRGLSLQGVHFEGEWVSSRISLQGVNFEGGWVSSSLHGVHLEVALHRGGVGWGSSRQQWWVWSASLPLSRSRSLGLVSDWVAVSP